uniref:Uncharacterized protein n=1 Tax=Rhizophora mucronata TaxID=61149 RepID=A0A2P2NJ05_RHIMU
MFCAANQSIPIRNRLKKERSCLDLTIVF